MREKQSPLENKFDTGDLFFLQFEPFKGLNSVKKKLQSMKGSAWKFFKGV